MEPLLTIEELRDRLPFVMDADDEREALGALESLSDDARIYGKSTWLTPVSTPQSVKNLVRAAAVRHMKNYDGYTQSRAGDETLMWTDRGEDAGSAYFTDREIRSLRTIARGSASSLVSGNTTAWGPMRKCASDNLALAPVDGPGGPEKPIDLGAVW